MIENRLLRYFLAVAKTRSITSAAERLHISQPALSKQLMELERQLGQPLLVRGKKSVSLTEAGELLQRRAMEILYLVEDTKKSIAECSEGFSGGVHVGCGESPSAAYVSKVFGEARQQHPMLKLHLSSGGADYLMEQLDQELLDIAMFTGPIPHEKYDYWTYPIVDSWGLLLKEDHPLAEKETVSLEDVYSVPLIFPERIYRSPWAPADFIVNRLRLQVAATYNSVGAARHMVQQGVGCGFCLSAVLLQEMNMQGLAYRTLKPEIFVNLSIIVKKNRRLAPAAQFFLENLRRELAEAALLGM